MELLGETNVVVSFFSYILFRLPNLLNLIIYFLVIYSLILLIKCLKIYIKIIPMNLKLRFSKYTKRDYV